MDLIIYKDIPCPILLKEEPDTFLILFKGEQKWIFECSLGYGKIIKNKNGIFHYFNDKSHREDGPAIVWNDGDKEWYQNGKLHREAGPACEYTNGTKKWFKNGLLHREDGPAIVWDDGDEEWFKYGKSIEWHD